ncbi:hypothetical protein Y032_0238g3287 [Ancylostoma ceylanicum]|uniref:Uncharacterized protein n=1 Tax=Ancylostoma ceylanicum TaxID=53326 RepID=A0A016SF53_9BILA|nr:hypothetical protein Y032_0238g3287 [Ancylostoma ceylanicum]
MLSKTSQDKGELFSYMVKFSRKATISCLLFQNKQHTGRNRLDEYPVFGQPRGRLFKHSGIHANLKLEKTIHTCSASKQIQDGVVFVLPATSR